MREKRSNTAWSDNNDKKQFITVKTFDFNPLNQLFQLANGLKNHFIPPLTVNNVVKLHLNVLNGRASGPFGLEKPTFSPEF